MTGTSTDGFAPFRVRAGEIRTVALEVNSDENPVDTLEAMARPLGGHVGATQDGTLWTLSTPDGGFFVDSLDPRFWLLHTMSPAHWSSRVLRGVVADSRDIDRCWLTLDRIDALRDRGQERWFKADFKGSDLLPLEGVTGRRLRVQFESDDPEQLQRLLRSELGSSTALTSVALRVSSPDIGYVDIAANYQGVFQSRGSSFDLHLGFAATTIQSYGDAVRAAEGRFGIAWEHADEGVRFTGQALDIHFERPIRDMDRFLAGLFSCRDPFRLWSVPRYVTPTFVESEVVDLHVGRQFRLDIFAEGMRVYLPSGTCGNTLFRLVANLQHRYDAAATARGLTEH